VLAEEGAVADDVVFCIRGTGGRKQRYICLPARPPQRDSGLILYVATGRRISNPRDSGSSGPGKHPCSIPAGPLGSPSCIQLGGVEIAVEN